MQYTYGFQSKALSQVSNPFSNPPILLSLNDSELLTFPNFYHKISKYSNRFVQIITKINEMKNIFLIFCYGILILPITMSCRILHNLNFLVGFSHSIVKFLLDCSNPPFYCVITFNWITRNFTALRIWLMSIRDFLFKVTTCFLGNSRKIFLCDLTETISAVKGVNL